MRRKKTNHTKTIPFTLESGMKPIFRIVVTITCLFLPFKNIAQSTYSFEFEFAPLLSNRSFTSDATTSPYQLEKHRSKSMFVYGFHFQAGINLRENKRTHLYAGVRLLNQNVMRGYFDPYNVSIGPNGQLIVDGFAMATRTDMLYITLPLLIKQTWFSKTDFRVVSELGVVPGFLLAAFPTYSLDYDRASLFGEFAMSFEWQLTKGNMLGIKFPALTYSLLPNFLIPKGIGQYNYSLALGIKIGIGDWGEPAESVTKKFKNKYSYELEIAPFFSNHIISFNEKIFENYNPANDDYLSAKSDYAEYSKLQSKFLPGGYFQFGINFREEKRTRFFIGMRYTEQRVMAIAQPIEDSLINSSGTTEYFRRFEFEQVRLGYLSIPIFLKQAIINKPAFRFGFETGVTPGILIYDDSKPQYSDGKFAAIQTEFSLSVEKKFKNGSWIGIKLPSFNYSLSPNIARYPTVQRNYSFGVGVRFIFPE